MCGVLYKVLSLLGWFTVNRKEILYNGNVVNIGCITIVLFGGLNMIVIVGKGKNKREYDLPKKALEQFEQMFEEYELVESQDFSNIKFTTDPKDSSHISISW